MSITIFIFILSSFICQKHFFYQSNFNRNCDFQTDCQRSAAHAQLRFMESLLSITANEVKKKIVSMLEKPAIARSRCYLRWRHTNIGRENYFFHFSIPFGVYFFKFSLQFSQICFLKIQKKKSRFARC